MGQAYSEAPCDDWSTPGGAGTFVVGTYSIDPALRVGSIDVWIDGIDGNNNDTHVRFVAGWKMVNGSLTLTGLNLALNIVPIVGVTFALVVTGGQTIEARLTGILGTPPMSGSVKFHVAGST